MEFYGVIIGCESEAEKEYLMDLEYTPNPNRARFTKEILYEQKSVVDGEIKTIIKVEPLFGNDYGLYWLLATTRLFPIQMHPDLKATVKVALWEESKAGIILTVIGIIVGFILCRIFS